MILQEFVLEFVSAKLKKSLIFSELIYDFPSLDEGEVHEDSFIDGNIFLISSTNPWYGNIIVYLQTLKLPHHLLRDER